MMNDKVFRSTLKELEALRKVMETESMDEVNYI